MGADTVNWNVTVAWGLPSEAVDVSVLTIWAEEQRAVHRTASIANDWFIG